MHGTEDSSSPDNENKTHPHTSRRARICTQVAEIEFNCTGTLCVDTLLAPAVIIVQQTHRLLPTRGLTWRYATEKRTPGSGEKLREPQGLHHDVQPALNHTAGSFLLAPPHTQVHTPHLSSGGFPLLRSRTQPANPMDHRMNDRPVSRDSHLMDRMKNPRDLA